MTSTKLIVIATLTTMLLVSSAPTGLAMRDFLKDCEKDGPLCPDNLPAGCEIVREVCEPHDPTSCDPLFFGWHPVLMEECRILFD